MNLNILVILRFVSLVVVYNIQKVASVNRTFCCWSHNCVFSCVRRIPRHTVASNYFNCSILDYFTYFVRNYSIGHFFSSWLLYFKEEKGCWTYEYCATDFVFIQCVYWRFYYYPSNCSRFVLLNMCCNFYRIKIMSFSW